jgi:DNA-binding beta-propeller fold protein YncE
MSVMYKVAPRPQHILLAAILLQVFAGAVGAATIGTVIPIRGHMSDIAVDAKRRLVYAANFTSNRIEAVSIDSETLLAPVYYVGAQPSSLAVSSDSRYLVVGHYHDRDPKVQGPGVTIINLETGQQQVLSLGTESVLAVAFGNSPRALLVLTTGVSLLDPATATLERLTLTDATSTPLPVPWATFPPEILRASAGASGDGNVIYVLVDGPPQFKVVRYEVDAGRLVVGGGTAVPPLGPRVVSVDRRGTTLVAGWALVTSSLDLIAQFP